MEWGPSNNLEPILGSVQKAQGHDYDDFSYIRLKR